jgi:hypothetical protein
MGFWWLMTTRQHSKADRVDTAEMRRRCLCRVSHVPTGSCLRVAASIKGRGAASNPEGRFESIRHHAEDDGWSRELLDESAAPAYRSHRGTCAQRHQPQRLAGHHFSQAINPYRGCEHGCIYCFARPSHSYLNLSPGLDFETKLRAKSNLAEVLRASWPSRLRRQPDQHRQQHGSLSADRKALAADPRRTELLAECHHPCTIVTKNALVERDLDILVPMARENWCRSLSRSTRWTISWPPSSSHAPARRIGGSRPSARWPMRACRWACWWRRSFPALNDRDMEAVLAQAADAGRVLRRLHHAAPAVRTESSCFANGWHCTRRSAPSTS